MMHIPRKMIPVEGKRVSEKKKVLKLSTKVKSILEHKYDKRNIEKGP